MLILYVVVGFESSSFVKAILHGTPCGIMGLPDSAGRRLGKSCSLGLGLVDGHIGRG